jgi:tripartite-type tricarboxylate transporter receptor subunit TctC
MRRSTRSAGRLAWLAIVLLLALAGVTAVAAQGSGEDFYRNQTIRILVNAAGGGFDASARTLARHLGRHIPGNPGVVVDVMSGASGLVAANYLYRVAKPDGLTIAHFSGDLLMGEVLGRPGIEFNARKFEYIGSGSNEHSACAFSRASGITSLDRWMASRTPVKMGGTAPGSNSDNATRILKAALGLPIQLVSGYKGTAAIRLAVESGELAGACFNWPSMRTTWRHALDTGDVVVVLQLAARPFADLPNVPLVTELARTEDARRLIAATILRPSGLARPYVAPPGTPKERVQLLRRAFVATMKDPEFLAEAAKAKLDVSLTRGEDVARAVTDLFATDPATVARLRTILVD